MRILIDLQSLQTNGAATRGVGRYTNGLLSALACSHQVFGLRRSVPYVVPPTASVPTIEIRPGLSETNLEQLISDYHFDVVVNCSGPYWDENVIVSGLRNTDRPLLASIFYDVIPWVFPHIYLHDPKIRRSYHNRCVDLYASADLVCAISQHSERDALRFGYATHETATTISLGVERLIPEIANAREKWRIPRPYLLSVSGDEFRKNPEMLIAAFLQSHIPKSRCLVVIISNDADSGFSLRMEAKYGTLRAQGVIILPEVTESELGALYRDCEAFAYTSLYEGFGIPIVEAMQFGKWVISSKASSLAEVSGPALLSVIEDPSNLQSIITALDQAVRRLDEGRLDEVVPRGHAEKFAWTQVVRNFETAVAQRHKVMALLSTCTPERPRLFWASPLPNDVSGIAFYSEDLVGPVSKDYDIILVPNTISTFVPTPKTGRFKIEEARAEALLALCNGKQPFVFYNMGNSHFHLELFDLLFTVPGIVLLHDSFVGGIEGLWRERNAGLATGQTFTTRPAATAGLRRWCWTLSKVDRLLLPFQPTPFRRILSIIARLPGMRRLVLTVAEFLRVSAAGSASPASIGARRRFDSRPLDVRIIESSWAMLFLGEHAKSLIGLEHLAKRPTHVVPLYCRYRGAISATRRAELRRKYAISEDAFVVTTTGFQATIKLTDQIIRDCMDLDRFESNSRVYVQVLGEFVDPAFEGKVRALWETSGLEGFISEGFVDEVTLTERVALSDVAVFLRSSSTGGPSAGLNDALGMGIPGLVTDDFAFREYPKTAVLHVPNCEVTEGLILLYRYPGVREALAAGALQYARDASLERIAARLGEIFSLYQQARSPRGRTTEAGHQVKSAMPHVFVDITYGLMQKVRSGLQRVEREIANGLRELDPGEKYFTFVAWDRTIRRFRLVSLEHLKKRDDLSSTEMWLAECPEATIDYQAHLFALSFSWPLGNAYFTDLLELSHRGVQISVLLPDLIPLRHRWTFYASHPKGSGIDQFELFCRRVVPQCANVLTISKYAMADIQKMLSEVEYTTAERRYLPRIHVLKLGAEWSTPFGDAQASDTLVNGERLVKNRYLLYVSSLDVRKNHGRLLEAFTQVRKRVDNLDLVLVGRVDGSISAATLECIKRSSWVHHFEGVDDLTLRRLYEECLFTVFPSLDEGYGLPVIESFRHGKFCLASYAGAIPEAGGEFADYFDPYDVQMLIQKILTYVRNPEELQRRQKLLELYRPTSWRETASQVAQIFYGDIANDAFMTQEQSERLHTY